MSYIVALTGGIASGKTTIANEFAQLDVPIVDADVIAKEVVRPTYKAFDLIVEHFGADILNREGALDRAKLRHIIFTQPTEKVWLNTLLHPLITEQTLQQFQQISAPYAIWVVPLLIEANLMSLADRILLIEVTAQQQLERTMQRDQCSEQLARKMIMAQATNAQRRQYAHDIIDNSHEVTKHRDTIMQLHHHYLHLAQEKDRLLRHSHKD